MFCKAITQLLGETRIKGRVSSLTARTSFSNLIVAHHKERIILGNLRLIDQHIVIFTEQHYRSVVYLSI